MKAMQATLHGGKRHFNDVKPSFSKYILCKVRNGNMNFAFECSSLAHVNAVNAEMYAMHFAHHSIRVRGIFAPTLSHKISGSAFVWEGVPHFYFS